MTPVEERILELLKLGETSGATLRLQFPHLRMAGFYTVMGHLVGKGLVTCRSIDQGEYKVYMYRRADDSN